MSVSIGDTAIAISESDKRGITTYGPSLGRAVGFFLTGLVYIVGASLCIYYGIVGLLSCPVS